jgi:hypothetical protein
MDCSTKNRDDALYRNNSLRPVIDGMLDAFVTSL